MRWRQPSSVVTSARESAPGANAPCTGFTANAELIRRMRHRMHVNRPWACVPPVCQLRQSPQNSAQLSPGRGQAKGSRYPNSSPPSRAHPNPAKAQLERSVISRSPVRLRRVALEVLPAREGTGALDTGATSSTTGRRTTGLSTRCSSALLILLAVPECAVAPQPPLVHPSTHGNLRVHVVVDPHLGLLRVQASQPAGVLDQSSLPRHRQREEQRYPGGRRPSPLRRIVRSRAPSAPRCQGSRRADRAPRGVPWLATRLAARRRGV